LKAGIFKEHTARRKRIAFLITNAFIMDASSKGLAEIAHQTLFKINNEVIFHGVRFFFAAVFFLLLGGIVWTLDATFCTINDEIHRQTQGERLLKVLRVSYG